MTKERTFSVLLAVAVALLGVDLALRLSPQEATAQPGPPLEPRLVGIATAGHGSNWVLRMWSDGVVEWRKLAGTHTQWGGFPEWQVVEQQ